VGSLTVAEKRQDVRLEWGVASHAQGNEVDCGDAYTIQPTASGFLVAVIDGLGHGTAAARAAQRAVDAINQLAEAPPQEILRACHRALLSSRGAAISLAQINLAEERLAWLGVGNVEGVVLNPVAHHQDSSWRSESLVVRGGVVGYELPNLQTGNVPFGLGAILVFATDGIKDGFSGAIRAGRPPQWAADQIMGGYDRVTDDALVLVVQHVWGGSDHTA
jgi:negative regulator of sigma-B (phosphoserine phosphatase)